MAISIEIRRVHRGSEDYRLCNQGRRPACRNWRPVEHGLAHDSGDLILPKMLLQETNRMTKKHFLIPLLIMTMLGVRRQTVWTERCRE